MVEEQSAIVRRKRIGLFLAGDYAWAGGLYYVLNIIKSLSYLNDSDKPEIVVFTSDITPPEILDEISYSYISYKKIGRQDLMSRVIGKIGRIVFKRPAYFDRTINAYKLDAVYPFTQFIDNVELNCEIVYWIYDFQHKYLPGMFSKEEIEKRDLDFSNIAKYGKKVVVSSLDALNSFKTFYPKSNASLHLLPFISIIDEKKISDFNAVKREHKIERQFFLVANQFWQHKNHMIVFKAVKILKENFPGILVVVTGRKESYGQTSYLSSLVDYINKYALSENIIFTNFIPRNEQLSLMKNCIAIIQPSKFEGWSTVIEDAKALNKTVIASDINVHREQLGENSHFFAPDDETKLVLILTSILKDNKEVTLNVDYNYLYKIQGFADNFIKMFS